MRVNVLVVFLLLASMLATGQLVQSEESESVSKTFIKTESVKLQDGSVVEVGGYLKNEGSSGKPVCRVTIKFKPRSNSDEASVMSLGCGDVDDASRILQQFKPWVKDKAAKLEARAGN
ncbi:MAG TPA: hypothetical protein VMB26_10930 [Candidatus Binataceae bacterium]|nr:hypothetical protein [Candidatus Binataceae bacterium]